jgi:signal transduction histidine kinase
VIGIGVPVTRDDHVTYVAEYSFGADRIQELLEAQGLPEGWIATVLDRDAVTIARSRDPQRWVMKHAGHELQTHIERSKDGKGIRTTQDGDRVFFAWTTSPVSGWRVAVGAPVEIINAPMRAMFVAFALAVLCVVAGMAVALVIGRRIGNSVNESVNRLSQAAIALGQGAPVPLYDGSHVNELDAAAQSLSWACDTVFSRAEEQERARQEAVAANKAKDEFIAVLAHEIRSPLAAIATVTELLDRKHVAERETAILGRQVTHLSVLVNDLFDAGRVVMDKFILVRRPMNLTEAVRHCVETLIYDKQRLEITVDAPVDVWISGDETRIHQVISNLLTNAVKFSPKGGLISVSVQNMADKAVLTVSDRGIGIPQELIPRVFDLFVQGGRTAEASASGMGIGLALVRRLIELHGGTVSVSSDGRDKGATFTVKLSCIDPLQVQTAGPAGTMP